jgi:hypothetical protein
MASDLLQSDTQLASALTPRSVLPADGVGRVLSNTGRSANCNAADTDAHPGSNVPSYAKSLDAFHAKPANDGP